MVGLCLDKDLEKALELCQFRLYYQPELNLASGKIAGVEAFIRWEHPEKGIISPVEFISLSEETGLIFPIGEWVLRTACIQSRVWQDAGLPPIIMAINVFERQLYHPNFVENVERILNETGLDPSHLELEITEGMAMDIPRVLPILKDLKRIGSRISLDNFGKGHSSLFNFKELPVDIIKIDQSFVSNCTNDRKDAKIVRAIITLAHELNVEVIAQGIKTRDQLKFLQHNLCDRGQGYLFSNPRHPEDFISKFYQLQHIIKRDGISSKLYKKQWLKESLNKTQQELADTLRNQQGMTFKFTQQDGRFIHTLCDGALLKRLGLTPWQVVGKELKNFLSKDDIEKVLQCYQRAWAGEENVTFDGKLNDVWYLAFLRPIRQGGQVVEVIGSCFDITERMKMERQIVEEKEKLESLLNNTQDAIHIMDLCGRILQVNPAWESVYGWTYEEVVGKRIPIVSQERFDNTWYRVVARLMSGEKISPYEIIACRKGGETLYASVSIHSINDANGNVVAVVASTRDMTEIKKAEELIRRSEKLSIVGQLAAGVAHEIKNPLTTIQGFIQLLQKEIDKPTYFELIMTEIARLNRIGNEFLVLANPQVAQRRVVNPQRLMEQVSMIMGAQALLHNIEIKQECEGNLPCICCDENQIKQVFINVLQNAIEAMSNGGIITVKITLPNLHSVQFRFIDEGSGISEERMRHLGEPFYSSKEKGTGLGLMISHKIVQEHDGTIQINSVVNQGTTVDVILPIAN